jgi:type II restriction enzyme
MAQLNKQEQKTLDKLISIPYMSRTIVLIEDYVSKHGKDRKKAYLSVFDEIFRILNKSKNQIDKYLKERKAKGEIKDEGQALRSITESSFPQAILYIFLKNKEIGNIREDIFISSKPALVPSLKDVLVIHIGNEIQKPNCNLVIYSLNKDKTLNHCMILSLKTSSRERAEQTYKWKLLLEIANSENDVKDKYKIKYNFEKMPLVAFAAVNFFDEINKPQIRGILKFFNRSFIASPIDTDFIFRMSTLPNYVNKHL